MKNVRVKNLDGERETETATESIMTTRDLMNRTSTWKIEGGQVELEWK